MIAPTVGLIGKQQVEEAMKALANRIEARHQAIGYGDYAGWIEAHT